MSTQALLASLCSLMMVVACGHRPAPAPAAALVGDSGCAPQDSGFDLGHDVSRGPRFRVDSSGRVETLPPVPAAGTDTGRQGCPAVPDTSAGAGAR